jgi:hypothetical protein
LIIYPSQCGSNRCGTHCSYLNIKHVREERDEREKGEKRREERREKSEKIGVGEGGESTAKEEDRASYHASSVKLYGGNFKF